MSGLGDNVVATIEYNGIDLCDRDAIAPPNMSLKQSPVYDETGRTVLWSDYTLRVSTTVWGDTESEARTQVDEIRRLLETPGKRLSLVSLGVGDIIVGEDNAINRGVKPRLISIAQVAGYQAIEIEWECTFSLSQSASANESAVNSICEFAYDFSVSIDDEGITSRTITGYMRKLSDQGESADAVLREKLEVTIPSGFRRVRQEYSESRDKTRVDFAIVDVEQASDKLPDNCTRASGRLTWATSSAGFANWMFSINASITVAPRTDPKVAGKRFFEAVQLYKKSIAQSTGGTVIPTALSVSPGLWSESRTTNFSITFMVIRKLSDLFAKGSIWHPYATKGALSVDWDGWQKTVNYLTGSKTPRGNAGLSMGKENNPIVDLSHPKDKITLNSSAKKSTFGQDAIESALNCDVGNEGYIGYRLQMRMSKAESVSIVHTAVEYIAEKVNQGLSFGGVNLNGATGANVFANAVSSVIGKIVGGSSGDKGHYIETHGTPHTRVLLEGIGMRVGRAPAKVTLSAIGGHAATPIEQYDVSEEYANYFGCAVILRRWWTLYDVAGDISGYDIPAPKNPANR